jgi:hypothetical protein
LNLNLSREGLINSTGNLWQFAGAGKVFGVAAGEVTVSDSELPSPPVNNGPLLRIGAFAVGRPALFTKLKPAKGSLT